MFRGRRLKLNGLVHQSQAAFFVAADMSYPCAQGQTCDGDVARKKILLGVVHRLFELSQPRPGCLGLLQLAHVRGAEPACEVHDRLGPGKPVPIYIRLLRQNEGGCLLPRATLESIARLSRSEMERGLERRLYSRCLPQPLDLAKSFFVRALLEISIDQVLDRVREFIPDELTFLARRIIQSRGSRPQISPHHRVPIAQA